MKVVAARPHPDRGRIFLPPRLRPQPQERGRDDRPWSRACLLPRFLPREQRDASNLSKTSNGPPSPGGEGLGEGGPAINHCCLIAVIASTLMMTTVGCGSKSSATAPVAEVRGEPIARAAVTGASSNAPAPTGIVTAANAKPETRNPEPDFTSAGFDILSGYNIEISDDLLGPVTNDLAAVSAKTEALIPPKVKAFDKKRVALKGFMLPLKVEGGLVTEMLIMKDQSMCCYGTVPKIHEWVSIKMTEKGVKPMMDQPVTLFGKLHVGEMRENGYLTGIYRMDGEKMAAPEEN